MIEFLTQLFALAKVPRVALACMLVSGALIFGPSEWLALLGVERVKTNWRTELGVTFLVSAAVLATTCFFYVAEIVSDLRVARARRSYLRKLTADEKAVLVPYIFDGETSKVYSYGDGVVQGLVARKILYRSSNIGHSFGFPYNLQLWARTYLEQNPYLLNDATPAPPPARPLPRHR